MKRIIFFLLPLALGCSSPGLPGGSHPPSGTTDLAPGGGGGGGGNDGDGGLSCDTNGNFIGPVNLDPNQSDPRAIASVHCVPAASEGDLTIDITQTKFESGIFSAVVKRTHPTPFQGSYCVNMNFSGDWGWEVNDKSGLILMLVGIDDQASNPGNLSIYKTANGTPIVSSQTLSCTDKRN